MSAMTTMMIKGYSSSVGGSERASEQVSEWEEKHDRKVFKLKMSWSSSRTSSIHVAYDVHGFAMHSHSKLVYIVRHEKAPNSNWTFSSKSINFLKDNVVVVLKCRFRPWLDLFSCCSFRFFFKSFNFQISCILVYTQERVEIWYTTCFIQRSRNSNLNAWSLFVLKLKRPNTHQSSY